MATFLYLTTPSRPQNRGPVGREDGAYAPQGPTAGVSPTRDAPRWVSPSLRTFPSSSVTKFLFFTAPSHPKIRGPVGVRCGRRVRTPGPLGPEGSSAGESSTRGLPRRFWPPLLTFPSNSVCTFLFYGRAVSFPEPGTGWGVWGTARTRPRPQARRPQRPVAPPAGFLRP